MQCLDHLFELTYLLTAGAGRCVAGVRSKEADGVVTPIVGQTQFEEVGFINEVLNGH